MKKISLSVILALVLVVCLLPVSAAATGILPQPDSGGGYYTDPIPGGSLPQPDVDVGGGLGGGVPGNSYPVSGSLSIPTITGHPYDVSATVGGVPASLWVDAYANGGQLGYQWYSLGSTPYGSRTPISGACMSSFTPSEVIGTVYYCVGVYTVSGGMRSGEVYSNAAAVSYSGIEIISVPNKLSYAVGEKVSLDGLWVRVYDANGSSWDSYNGQGLNVYPSSLSSAGTVAVEVSTGTSAASFNVTVGNGKKGTDPNHEHKFGEWEVTKEATCVTTGSRTRSCECGETETEEILKTDHSWDEGTITKEPTKSSNGARLYTCEVCQANRSEIIPAGTDVSGTKSPGPTTSLDAAQNSTSGTNTTYTGSTYGNTTYPTMPTSPANAANTAGSTASGQSGTLAGTEGTSGLLMSNEESSGWWLIPVSAALLVGVGIGAYYLMRKRIGDE